jgi:hypothetical protein
MGPQRVVVLLVAGLAVLAGAIWLASTRHLERATLAGDLVLPGLEQGVNGVTELDLKKADGTHTTLKKDGSAWTVAERGWPADTPKVRKLLLDLGALTVVEEKTRLAANYPQLGVEDVSTPHASGTRIDAVSPNKSWGLIIGKASSGKSGYVRVANAAQSVLAAPVLMVDAAPAGWLERTLTDLGAERVREIEERPANGPEYTATRLKQGEPNFSVSPIPKGRSLTGPAVAEPIAASLAVLSLDEVRKADPGAASNGASHATFRTYDGLELALSGRQDGDHYLIAARAQGSSPQGEAEAQKLNTRLGGFEFEIPQYRYEVIFKPLMELLTVAPELDKKKARAAKANPLSR